MKRKDVLTAIMAAAANGDTRIALRIYTENRVSFEAYQKAVAKGKRIAKALAGRDATAHISLYDGRGIS